MEVFLAIEDELTNLGHIIGVYSKIEIACEEVKRYFNSPVLLIDGEIASYDDVSVALDDSSRTIAVETPEGFRALIFKRRLDESQT